MFWDETKKAFQLIKLKPEKQKSTSVWNALVFYYKATVIPVILAVVVAAVGLQYIVNSIYSLLVNSAGFDYMLTSVYNTITTAHAPLTSVLVKAAPTVGVVGIVAGVIIPILAIWVIIPIGVFVSSVLIHLFGKLFGKFKNGYSKTFNAVINSVLVTSLFFWVLILLLVIGATATISLGSAGFSAFTLYYLAAWVIQIWGIITLVVWTSRFQKTSLSGAFGVIVATSIIVSIIIAIIGLLR